MLTIILLVGLFCVFFAVSSLFAPDSGYALEYAIKGIIWLIAILFVVVAFIALHSVL